MKTSKIAEYELLKQFILNTKRTTGLCEDKKAERYLKMRWIPLWWS